MDQIHVKRSKWNFLFKKTQMNPEIPLFRDRERELADFFHISRTKLRSLYIRFGFPNTQRFKRHLDAFFRNPVDPNWLKMAYEKAAFFYCLRLMLAFERYSMIADYLETLFLQHGSGRDSLGNWKVLDFGCGVSDIGLLLGLLDARVTICDLADEKLSFAEWRYRRRKMEVEVIPISHPLEIPALGEESYDFIIATEVLEHVPDPFQCLKVLTRALIPGGLLFNSMGNGFNRKVGADHLESALIIGNSEEYRHYYQATYTPLVQPEGLSYLFRKVVS